MKKITLLFFAVITIGFLSAQQTYPKCDPSGAQQKISEVYIGQAIDFTITDTEGNTHNLFQTLTAGKTVVLDFFITSCSSCAQNASIIEQSYQEKGAGSGDIVYWGLNHGENNTAVASFKTTYTISNPCASGIEGGADDAISLYKAAFNFTGYPTYTVICPNKNVYWDVNFPPTSTGFDIFFNNCTSSGIDGASVKPGIRGIYPNPAFYIATIDYYTKDTGPVSYELYNSFGQKVLGGTIKYAAQGENRMNLPLEQIQQGNYYLKIFNAKSLIDVQKIIKVE
jgi:hypothetical protein